ncbi:glycoside hydrolase family 26 protein [Mesorhizobium sp. 10J20-29]
MRLSAVATLPVAVLAAALCLTGMAGATEIGAYRGPGCDGRKAMAEFETFIGRKAERTVDALNAESWREMRRSIPWIVKCWSGSGIALTLSVPMLPRGGGSTLREGADGAYDQVFLDTARALVRYGQQDAIVRIGWEFNGDWVPWAASKDPEAYKLYFRRIVETMRSVPGQAFLFEWCPNHGRHAMDPTEAYPGDDVVDVIGMDVYAEEWNDPDADPAERFRNYLEQPFGLKWHRDFARERGKPTSYPEWGVGDKPGGHGVGDDPVFIAGMADWFEEAKPLYQSYWDVRASDYNARMSDFQFPAAAEMFQRRFGAAAVHSGN